MFRSGIAGVTLDQTTLSLTVGAPDVKLTATVAPDNATDKTVSWSSDKADVATVDQEGNVHAVAAGSATITVTTTDGGKTATCAVAVKAIVTSTITDLYDQIDNLINKDYYFANVLPKLEIIDADLDKISGQMNSMMEELQTITIQQQAIDLLDAKNKRSEFANKIIEQNNRYLHAIDTILSKLLYLEKHPGEESVLVGLPLFPKGEEEELSKNDLEQRLCQNLELWHKYTNQAHTKVVEFMEHLKDYASGVGYPGVYDEAVNIAIPSKQDGYDARVNFRLVDMDIVMKTVHLAGLYQQRMIQALDNMEEDEWCEYFPMTPYPVSDAQLSSSKAQLTSEKDQLQDTYSKFFNFYNEIEVVVE